MSPPVAYAKRRREAEQPLLSSTKPHTLLQLSPEKRVVMCRIKPRRIVEYVYGTGDWCTKTIRRRMKKVGWEPD